MRVDLLVELAGWVAAAAIVAAYALTTWRILPPDGALALALNLSGAAGVAVISWRKRAYQPAALNLIWFAVAGVALLRVIFS